MSTHDLSTHDASPGGAPDGERRTSAGRLTRGLVDDAAIFPPGNAPLDRAVAEHRQHRRAPYAAAIGPLLVRMSDATSLNGLLRDDEGLAVGLVCPPDATAGDIDRAVADVLPGGRAVVVAIEQPPREGSSIADVVAVARRHGARLWAEVPAASTVDGTLSTWLDDVTAAGSGAKFRTGGVQPQAFPSEEQLAAFVGACVSRRLPFKLTAGLHHAVRHTAPSAGADGEDLEQHGLLNVVTAVAAAQHGSSDDQLAALLADRDAKRVAARVAALDDRSRERVRAAFVSFGCCGVTDPLTDLVTLALLEPGQLDRPADKETS